MTQQVIDLGQLPDGAGGDTNRSANVKCNENFTELYEGQHSLGETIDGKAAKGDNNDITSLSGLATPLSIEQGGTGAASGREACLKIGAVVISAKNQSHGTTLVNGGMPAIAGMGTDLIGSGPLILDNDGNHHASCVMTFHRGNAFACYFGLDTDNRLKVGGASFGTNAYIIYHEGNTARSADGTLKAI